MLDKVLIGIEKSPPSTPRTILVDFYDATISAVAQIKHLSKDGANGGNAIWVECIFLFDRVKGLLACFVFVACFYGLSSGIAFADEMNGIKSIDALAPNGIGAISVDSGADSNTSHVDSKSANSKSSVIKNASDFKDDSYPAVENKAAELEETQSGDFELQEAKPEIDEVVVGSNASRTSASSTTDANGWYTDNATGSICYYVNGVKATSKWIVTSNAPDFDASSGQKELQRYWFGQDGILAISRLINPNSEIDAAAGWFAYATPYGYVVRGKCQ